MILYLSLLSELAHRTDEAKERELASALLRAASSADDMISQAEDRLPSEYERWRTGVRPRGRAVKSVGMRSSSFAGMSQFICHVRMMNQNDRAGAPPYSEYGRSRRLGGTAAKCHSESLAEPCSLLRSDSEWRRVERHRGDQQLNHSLTQRNRILKCDPPEGRPTHVCVTAHNIIICAGTETTTTTKLIRIVRLSSLLTTERADVVCYCQGLASRRHQDSIRKGSGLV